MADTPTSIASADLTLFGVTITVHQLDNGMRIIEQEDFGRLIEAMAAPDCPEESEEALMTFASLMSRP